MTFSQWEIHYIWGFVVGMRFYSQCHKPFWKEVYETGYTPSSVMTFATTPSHGWLMVWLMAFGLPHYTSLVFLVWNFRNYLEGCLIFLVLMFQIILWYQCFFLLDILFGVLQKYWTSTSSAFETSFSPTTNGHFWINSPSGARQPDPIGCWGQQIWAISDTLWLWPTVRHGIDGP